ncbi:hypothetical protein NLX86_07120 [Streptomyces sp. A3M-1-3]|uniref:hypothetical protein n=1 Tax=Streptomyces sp. A3M-1-3 TaxID=2962044 RepID=UPI0020B7900D|nr:hypothetical protein [Streptomyces sp. A3M-1-3]MCP3817913.1 hypothetical protein [Streptomyces sp. A3M-1-3]
MKKSREQAITDNLWALPALFISISFVCFWIVKSDAAAAIGWWSYFLGWIPAVSMLVWCRAKGKEMGGGAVFAFVALPLFGLLFWLNHG